jgi:hypothetical protein
MKNELMDSNFTSISEIPAWMEMKFLEMIRKKKLYIKMYSKMDPRNHISLRRFKDSIKISGFSLVTPLLRFVKFFASDNLMNAISDMDLMLNPNMETEFGLERFKSESVIGEMIKDKLENNYSDDNNLKFKIFEFHELMTNNGKVNGMETIRETMYRLSLGYSNLNNFKKFIKETNMTLLQLTMEDSVEIENTIMEEMWVSFPKESDIMYNQVYRVSDKNWELKKNFMAFILQLKDQVRNLKMINEFNCIQPGPIKEEMENGSYWETRVKSISLLFRNLNNFNMSIKTFGLSSVSQKVITKIIMTEEILDWFFENYEDLEMMKRFMRFGFIEYNIQDEMEYEMDEAKEMSESVLS